MVCYHVWKEKNDHVHVFVCGYVGYLWRDTLKMGYMFFLRWGWRVASERLKVDLFSYIFSLVIFEFESHYY